MNKLFICGGRQRTTVIRKLEEWQSCECAVIVELNPGKGESRVCVEYVSPPDAVPEELPSFLFKSGTLKDNKLYTCTSTEVLIYELPTFRPCFDYRSAMQGRPEICTRSSRPRAARRYSDGSLRTNTSTDRSPWAIA